MTAKRRAALGALVAVVILAVGVFYLAQRPPAAGEVVVYTSVDEVQARQVLGDFERRTGIKVRPVYDTEAAKTTGLVMRIIAETSRPTADVYWSNELSRTIELASRGALGVYVSPAAADIPAQWKDANGRWASSSLRARVIVYNSELVSAADAPRTLEDLTGERWRNKVGIADPRFGTTASHAAALAAAWGKEKSLDYFRRLAANGARVYQGNSLVRDAAAAGEILAGLTDTDDVLVGQARGMKISMAVPDQGADGMGTLVMPNSVARIAGAPHPDEAAKLIDFLLSKDVERQYAKPEEGLIPVRVESAGSDAAKQLAAIKQMDVDWTAVSATAGPFSIEVASILVK